jgi:hypothetical protein
VFLSTVIKAEKRGGRARVFDGWEFRATLSFRTPLSVLQHDGDVLPLGRELPVYGARWAGAWRLRPKPVNVVRRVAGLALPEIREPVRRSDLGPMPADGGAFLVFLRTFRSIVESNAASPEKASQINALRDGPAFVELASRIPPTFGDDWMSLGLAKALSVPITVARSLFAHGYCDVESVGCAPDEQLQAIKGIGPTRIAAFRHLHDSGEGTPEDSVDQGSPLELETEAAIGMRSSKAPRSRLEPASARRAGARDENDLAGMKFRATLQMRTPLHVLEHDGEVLPVDAELPTYGPTWAGRWSPFNKTDIDLPTPSLMTRSSDIGWVREDGGAYLPFLKRYRRIIETPDHAENKLKLLDELRSAPEHVEFARRLPANWPQTVVHGQLRSELQIDSLIALRLFDAGFRDANAVRSASDEQLRAIKGIGPKRLAAIRVALDG